MSEFSDDSRARNETPADAPPPSGKPKRKRKKYKDLRRRPPTGNPVGRVPLLTPVQLEILRQKIGECWTDLRIRRHFAEQWGVSHECVRQALVKIYADIRAARDAVPANERAAAVCDAVKGFISKCYEVAEGDGLEPGDTSVLRAVPQALDKLARIEGAYASERIEHSGSVGLGLNIGDMPEDKLKARIVELMEKHGASLRNQGG